MLWKNYPINEQIRIQEMFSLFKTHYESTYEFHGETHDFWECLYVISGTLCVSADERVYNLSAGNIIFHKPLEMHKFHITSQNEATILIFSFSATGTLIDFFRNKIFRLSTEQEEILSALTDYMDEKLVQFGSDLQNKEKEYHYLALFKKIPTYSQTVALYISRLMLSLAEESNVAKASTSPESMIFSKAVRFMNDNLCKKLSVSDIAAHCSISVSGLKRIFDKLAGISVHKYFLLLKFKAAKKMLHCGNSVSDTAETLGFSSQAYFSKSYKREMGILPSKET